ncbi:hypothetical protein K2X85_01075 [bacterium]|nr:hypothetical protein [bacterium]
MTWDLRFLDGTVPMVPVEPGSDTTPVDGAFTGTYDPDFDLVQFSELTNPGPLFQPDLNSFPPANASGLLSSVAGTFNLANVLFGTISTSQVSFGVDYLSNDFRFFELHIGSSLEAAPELMGISLNALASVNSTGLFNLDFKFTTNSLPEFKLVTARYTRLSKYTGEWEIPNLDWKLEYFTGITLNGLFIPGDLTIRGNIIATITTVPEANTFLLLTIAGLGVLVVRTRGEEQRT